MTTTKPAAPKAQSRSGLRNRLTIRPALRSDATPLRFFFDTALRDDYFIRRGQLDEILSSPQHRVWVAEVDTILVGVAITTQGTRLVNALIHPAYRGLGLGSELIRHIGITEVRAKIDMSTGDPRPFYEHAGFERTGQFNRKGNIELLRLSARTQRRHQHKPRATTH